MRDATLRPVAPLDEIEAAARAAKRDALLRALTDAKGNRTRAGLAAGYSGARAFRLACERFGVDLSTHPAPQPEDTATLRLTDEERAARPPAPKRKPRAKKKAAKRAARGKR